MTYREAFAQVPVPVLVLAQCLDRRTLLSCFFPWDRRQLGLDENSRQAFPIGDNKVGGMEEMEKGKQIKEAP